MPTRTPPSWRGFCRRYNSHMCKRPSVGNGQQTGSWARAQAIALMAMCYNGDAGAQVVAVAFESAQTQIIPISSWAVAIVAAGLGLAAYRALRSRGGATLPGLLAAILTASVVTATLRADWIREAHADDPSPLLSLVTSPALFTIGPAAVFDMIASGAGYQITVVNSTGRPVTITGLSIEENIPSDPLVFYSSSPGPECVAGLSLAVNAACYVYVEASFHFN